MRRIIRGTFYKGVIRAELIKRLVQMFNYQQFFFRFQYVIIDDIDRQSVTKAF